MYFLQVRAVGGRVGYRSIPAEEALAAVPGDWKSVLD